MTFNQVGQWIAQGFCLGVGFKVLEFVLTFMPAVKIAAG